MKKKKIKKEVEKMKSEQEYIFFQWATDQGWNYDISTGLWSKGSDKLTSPQLRRVFQDYKNNKI